MPLVTDLIREQFPQWADLPISPVIPGGWDNRTFHLGDEMSIRLPSAERYAAKARKEHKWLLKLAPQLSISIPELLGVGKPSTNYPWYWSVYRWIEGETADVLMESGLKLFASGIAQFLSELHEIDTTHAPSPGPHNFFRGGNLSVYNKEAMSAISQTAKHIDGKAATAVWEKALRSRWHSDPVWIHGDIAVGNILVKDHRLEAIIDFGGMGVGDPACDLVIAWTFLSGESREAFKSRLDLDPDTWDRARGWALWKALITLVSWEDKTGEEASKQQQIIEDIINDQHENRYLKG